MSVISLIQRLLSALKRAYRLYLLIKDFATHLQDEEKSSLE